MTNQCAGPFGATYDFYIDRPWLSHLVGRSLWGIDVRPMYASMAATIRTAADGATIVDVPSGGGVALRELDPVQDVTYVAVDIVPEMLQRVRAKAAVRGLTQVQTVEADMRRLPLDDASADLVLSYSGLHMVADPEVAVAELARVLRPGGELTGSTFTADGTRRQRRLFASGERRGIPAPPQDAAVVHGWLEAAGLVDVDVRGRGFAVFRARRPGR